MPNGRQSNPMKYAVIERERRFLVSTMPHGAVTARKITDSYLTGTRMRLRETVDPDGAVIRKLGHKVRLEDGPRVIACTSFYLDDEEWNALAQLPARQLRKTRHIIEREGWRFAVDEFADGTLLAEIDEAQSGSGTCPAWLAVIEEVTDREEWTGGALAR